MTLSRNTVLVLCSVLVMAVGSCAEENDSSENKKKSGIYQTIHANYDELGTKDGLVSYEEIKRALGGTTEEEWKKEIQPHDDGDQLLTPTELENWLTSFKKKAEL